MKSINPFIAALFLTIATGCASDPADDVEALASESASVDSAIDAYRALLEEGPTKTRSGGCMEAFNVPVDQFDGGYEARFELNGCIEGTVAKLRWELGVEQRQPAHRETDLEGTVIGPDLEARLIGYAASDVNKPEVFWTRLSSEEDPYIIMHGILVASEEPVFMGAMVLR